MTKYLYRTLRIFLLFSFFPEKKIKEKKIERGGKSPQNDIGLSQ